MIGGSILRMVVVEAAKRLAADPRAREAALSAAVKAAPHVKRAANLAAETAGRILRHRLPRGPDRG